MNDIHQITDLGGTTHDLKDYRIPTFPADTKQFLNGGGAWSALVDAIYPIGSIYMSTANSDPALLFGGTWAALENRFLVGAGDTYTAGVTGGEATHTLTAAELPTHTHYAKGYNTTENSNWTIPAIRNITGTSGVLQVAQGTDRVVPASKFESDASWGNLSLSSETGGITGTAGTAHNNLPPYLPVYMWERTA